MGTSVKTTGNDSFARDPSAALEPGNNLGGTFDSYTLVGDYFPVLLSVTPRHYSDTTPRQMADAFEEYFKRGERYVVIAVTPHGGEAPDAKQRKLITDWINSPRVMSYSARLCLGSANIVSNALMRGLHTALLWAWSPPFPIKPVPSARLAVDYTFARLEEAGVPYPRAKAALRAPLEERLRNITGLSS